MLKKRIICLFGIHIFILTILPYGELDSQLSSKEIVLQSQNMDKKLIYRCDAFRHQVKQGEDLPILMPYVPSTMKGLVQNNDVITAQALERAFDRNDVRRVEEIVVEYRCNMK